MGFKCTCASAKDRKKRKKIQDRRRHPYICSGPGQNSLSFFFIPNSSSVDFCDSSLNSTWSIREGPDEGGQHLDGGRGVGVTVEPVLHLPAETTHDVLQRLVRQTHGVQVLVNLKTQNHRVCQLSGHSYSGQWVAVESIATVLTLKVKHWHLDGMLHHNSLFKFNYLYVSGY